MGTLARPTKADLSRAEGMVNREKWGKRVGVPREEHAMPTGTRRRKGRLAASLCPVLAALEKHRVGRSWIREGQAAPQSQGRLRSQEPWTGA